MKIVITVFSVFLIFTTKTLIVYAHEIENENAKVIHIDENGFDPNKVAMTVGDEVIFENVGKENHWPASDNHSTHTLYDGTSLEQHCAKNEKSFDACGPIEPGETWSFVFEKSGSFPYHDHLWPHLIGQIIVKGDNVDSNSDKNILLIIKNIISDFFRKIYLKFFKTESNPSFESGDIKNDFYNNLKTKYREIVLNQDPREAILTLEKESANDEKISALCHDILHEIGRSAYKKYGSFSEAAKYQSDFCNSGYIHGVFENYFASTNNPTSNLKEECTQYAAIGGRKFDLWQCRHGAGHGFMYLTGGDLDKSLQLCTDAFGNNAVSCQNGVYMEVFNLEVLAKEENFVESENPFLTCRIRNIAKSDCYLYVPTYLSQTKGKSYDEIFDMCSQAEKGYVGTCIAGTGAEAINRNMANVETVFGLCSQVNTKVYQQACIQGVVGMYMNQKGSYEAGKEICNKTPDEFRDICLDTVLSRESFFE